MTGTRTVGRCFCETTPAVQYHRNKRNLTKIVSKTGAQYILYDITTHPLAILTCKTLEVFRVPLTVFHYFYT